MWKKLVVILILMLVMGCGGGMRTKDPSTDKSASYPTPWGDVTITKDAFIFGSDYPADIVIPDIDGMRDTAFVVSFLAPSGVLAIDLETNPLALSSKFTGVISPAGTGYPNSVLITGTTRGYLLTSSHVIIFNPTGGEVMNSINILEEHNLSEPMSISSSYDVDGDGIKENTIDTIEMTFPAGLASSQGKLYITMSNYISPAGPAVAAPGLVRVFDITSNSPYLKKNKNIVTTDFNPTGITPLPNGLIAITNSGVSDIWDGVSHPLTNSSINLIDPLTNEIAASINLGNAALNYQEIAITSDGKLGFIGSSSFGMVYVIDFSKQKIVDTYTNPISITGTTEGSDYLTSQILSYDNWHLFVASFDNSSIYPVDIATSPPELLPPEFNNPFVLGFPKGVTSENPTGANTGIGDMAVRPGIPGVDYTGPDIFALTGYPGTMVTINTHDTDKENSIQFDKMEIVPTDPNVDETENRLQFYLNIELSDGTTETEITDKFTNPYNGYPVKVNWDSSKSSIASITGTGKVTFKSAGQTTITAQIGQRTAQTVLTIEGTNPYADKVIEVTYGTDAGFGQDKMPGVALGPPGGTNSDIVTLGNGGQIILEMTDFIIADGEGPDFTVFENPFYVDGNSEKPFSEAGTVSVSADGVTFHEFDCDLDDSPKFPGCAGTIPTLAKEGSGIDPTDPAVSGGNQFDLSDVGLETARFVKIVDDGVPPEIGGAPFSGFDLDAIAVINGVVP
jgi:hypothetical protein